MPGRSLTAPTRIYGWVTAIADAQQPAGATVADHPFENPYLLKRREKLKEDKDVALLDRWRSRGERRQQEAIARSSQVRATLTQWRADRAIAADELSNSLREFVAQLQAESQQLLSSNCQQRREIHARGKQERSAFLEALRSNVETDLQEWELRRHSIERSRRRQNRTDLQQLKLKRQDLAREVRETLSQSRAQRWERAKTSSERLTKFRQQLHRYRADLTKLVWGDLPDPTLPSTASTPPAVPEVPEVPEVALRSTPEESRPDAGGESTASVDTEAVYNYIQFHPGIRLAELEQALEISRVQAVDALRFLIQTGAIAQRDRLYFPQ